MRVTPPYKVALLSYHPISYHAAFYRAVHNDNRLLEMVLYLDTFGICSAFDAEFQDKVKWGNEVLTGYRLRFFKNFAWKGKGRPIGPLGCINPGIFFHICFSNYDAIVTDYASFSAWLAYAAALIRGIPIILRGESDLVKERPRSLWVSLKNLALPYMISRAMAVLYSCKKNKEYFMRYGAKEESLFPILSSADTSQFANIVDKRDYVRRSLRERYGIPDDAFVIVFVGRLIPRKRPMDILQACIQIDSEGQRVWCIFVGDGPSHRDLEAIAKRHNFQRIVITGFQHGEELAQHYLIGDTFVLPSEWDPTPKALNEAITCGIPSIVSAGVGLADDLIIDGVSGLIFPVGNVACLATHIRRLLVDNRFCDRLAESATEMAKEWTPAKNAEGLTAALSYIYAGHKS
jgi:glycosyltransferase involved in cell wall biosynthesis